MNEELRTLNPQIAIERSLLKARDGVIEIADFFDELIDSRITLIYKEAPNSKDNFYFLEHERQGLVLVVYTSTDRIQTEESVVYTESVEVDFRAVFDIAEGIAGFILNPGWDGNIVVPLDILTEMVETYGK